MPRVPPLARRTSRSLSLLLSSAIVLGAPASWAQGSPNDPKAHMTAADKAARAKDYNLALKEYEAASAAGKSVESLEGTANARVQLGQPAQAYEAYAEILKTFGDKLPKPKKASIEARLKVLAEQTGTFTVNVNQAGATVLVDGKSVGTSPLASPVRVAVGPHVVRVTKEGFLPFEQAPNAAAGGNTMVSVSLEAESNKGRLAVTEKTGQPVHAIVDGVDMGPAPWEGDVDAGPHEVRVRSATLASTPEKVDVERAKTKQVALSASATTAQLKVTLSDGKGIIYLDGKVVGEGAFSAEVPAGPHKIAVTREGFDRFEQEAVIKEKEPLALSVTLKMAGAITTGKIEAAERPLEGIYGGFGLAGFLMPGGSGDDVQNRCHDVGATACSDGAPAGAGLFGYFGYHWNPIGLELMLGGEYDQVAPSARFPPPDLAMSGGLSPDPARTEDFTIHRVGGFTALRARYTVQGQKLRGSFAAGAGLAYKTMLMTRETTLIADPTVKDGFAPDAQSYLAPLITADASIQWRVGAPTAFALGTLLLIESPSTFNQTPRTPPDPTRTLGPAPLSTPGYSLATSTQAYFGLYLGMQFGP